MPPSVAFFLDFDGTITRCDATDAILEAFANAEWLQIEHAWLSGQIGSRECLAAQMALVAATPADINRLLDGIEVDQGFATLVDACAARAVPLHIISDGFDYCIARILGRPDLGLLPLLASTQIVSSHLESIDTKWRATFAHPLQPCRHGCATCKPLAIEHLTLPGAIVVFVGDGLSDRYAAMRADVVFAKDNLATLCERESIPYTPYDSLTTVAASIDRLLAAATPRSLSRKESPAV
jgi:2-hydroxy-3-keto-5-methylthiopentenyl-1-phosphate phosphatase